MVVSIYLQGGHKFTFEAVNVTVKTNSYNNVESLEIVDPSIDISYIKPADIQLIVTSK